jgi:hypothetical protein
MTARIALMKNTRHDIGEARQRKRSEAGQSMLEFALLLPFVLLLGVGVVEVGRAIYFTMAVTNAAAAGVTYGSQSAITAMDTAGMQSAANSESKYGSMTSTATYGCSCDYNTGASCTYPVPPTSSCASISCSSGQIVQCVQVTTHASFPPIFHYPGLPTTYQANGRAVMRVRR